MPDPHGQVNRADTDARRRYIDQVGSREQRKLRKRRWADRSPWFWVGMFGLVGWSVATPTVIGVLLGMWIDRHHPGQYSWTLMLLFVGLFIGCATAWFWVKRESGLTSRLGAGGDNDGDAGDTPRNGGRDNEH